MVQKSFATINFYLIFDDQATRLNPIIKNIETETISQSNILASQQIRF